MVDMEPIRQDDPSSVAGFRIAGRLGEGWQGTVFSGVADDGTQVAVKLLHADLIGAPPTAERFVEEMQAFIPVALSCSARVLGAGMYLYQPYVISEYVDGFSLADSIRVNGPCQGPALNRLAVNTAMALDALHQAGLRHGDFHPANVLLGPDGPTVIDVGVVRALDQSTGTAMSGQMIGSPEYVTPEQIADHERGPAADVFAWAATVVFAATGKPPFAGDSPEELFENITSSAPALDGLQSPLRDLVTSCLVKDPSARPNSAQLVQLLSLNTPAAAPALAPAPVPEPVATSEPAAPEPAPAAEPVSEPEQGVSAEPEPVPVAEPVSLVESPVPVPEPEQKVSAEPVPAAESASPAESPVPVPAPEPAPAPEQVPEPAPAAETVTLAGWPVPILAPRSEPVPAPEQTATFEPVPVAAPVPPPGWHAQAVGPVPAAVFPPAQPAARRRRTGMIVVGAAVVAVVLVAVPAVALGMRKGDESPKVLAITTSPAPAPEPSVDPTVSPASTVPVVLAPKIAKPSKTPRPAKKPKNEPDPRRNMIANGGFEHGLNGWASGNGMPVGNGQHSGKGAAQFNAGPAGEGWVQRVISGLRPKTTYRLTGWVRSTNGNAFLGARGFDASVGLYLPPVTVNTYMPLSGTFTTGAGVTTATVFCWRKEPGSGWCDDIAVHRYK